MREASCALTVLGAMPDAMLAGIVLLALVAGLAIWYWRWTRHQIAASRVPEREEQRRYRLLRVESLEPPWLALMPWVIGIAGFFIVLAFVPMGPIFAAAIGFLLWVAGLLIRTTFLGRRTLLIETQLAAAIDHMVTSLHAGVGVVEALSGAERDAKRPLKPHLSQFLLRLRLGDDPPAVCRELADILPLESFRLFYYSLGVQWEGGGNLAPTLATTGKFIRERVEMGRRVRAQSTEARFSVLAIIGLTYFLAALMWRLDPDRVEGFLSTEIGELATSIAVILQALGAAWIARMSRIRY